MQYKTLEAEHKGMKFKIEEDTPQVGSYLYVYEADVCIKDYLQNSIAICKHVALENYGVPIDGWTEKR